MRLSHSKLCCILSCPMSYYLNYVCGISKKEEKRALLVGSAFHWGVEHGVDDLTPFFNENGTFAQRDSYCYEQQLAEAMVGAFLKRKDEIYKQILTDPETGEQLQLLEEHRELFIDGKIPSKEAPEGYQTFVGIVDLLLKTNKGWIILDYKTSSFEPDWDSYLDQIYRYIFLLRSAYPDIPVCKIGIINARKTGIRQKRSENGEEFMNRLRYEYEVDESLISYHEYDPRDLDPQHVDDYINNLAVMCDVAYNIDKNKLFFINYGAAVGKYGKSDYYDMFYHNPDAYLTLQIRDKVWNEETQQFLDCRDCVPLDMKMMEMATIMNKYDLFLNEFTSSEYLDKLEFFKYLRSKYECDDTLLETYWNTLMKEGENAGE